MCMKNTDLSDCAYEHGISHLKMCVPRVKVAVKCITYLLLHVVQSVLRALWFPFYTWGIWGTERSQVLLSQSNTIVSSHLSKFCPRCCCLWILTLHSGCEFSAQQDCKLLKGSHLHLCTFDTWINGWPYNLQGSLKTRQALLRNISV